MQQNSENQYSVLAATFRDVEDARNAATQLQNAGFGEAWIGVSKTESHDKFGDSAAQDRVEADNWFQRFMGEGDETLHDALVKRGVLEDDAAAAGMLGAHAAVLTVEGYNHPEEAAQLLSTNGGRLITSGYGATGKGTGGVHTLYDQEHTNEPDYGQFREGETLDDARRLQLREERLRIQRERISSDAVQIRKKTIMQHEELDVPLMHEEIFIERRPISGDTGVNGDAGTLEVGDHGAIGDDVEIISVPLLKERLRIEKELVPTEEIIVHKRSVTDIQHVSETTRKEILDEDATETFEEPGTRIR